MSDKNAVVLLSGGLDSTTVLAIAQDEGYAPFALSFRYGQRHATELDAARRIAAGCGCRWARGRGHRSARVRRLGADGRHRRAQGPLGWRDGRRDPDHLRAGAQHDLPLVRAGVGRGARRERHLRGRQRARLQRVSGLPAGVHRGVRADGEPGHQGRRRGHAAAEDPRAADAAHEGGHHPPRARAGRRLLGHAELLRPGRARVARAAHCDACQLRLRGFAAAGVPDPAAYQPDAAVRR